jgi:hypothetical protein
LKHRIWYGAVFEEFEIARGDANFFQTFFAAVDHLSAALKPTHVHSTITKHAQSSQSKTKNRAFPLNQLMLDGFFYVYV